MLQGKFQPKRSYCSLKQRFLYKIFHPSLPLQWSAESKSILLSSFFGVFTVLIFVDQFSLIHFRSLVADLSLKKKVFPLWIIQTSAGYKNASLALSTGLFMMYGILSQGCTVDKISTHRADSHKSPSLSCWHGIKAPCLVHRLPVRSPYLFPPPCAPAQEALTYSQTLIWHLGIRDCM